RLYTQQREKVRGHAQPLHPLGRLAARAIKKLIPECAHVLKRPILGTPIEPISYRQWYAISARCLCSTVPHHYQALRIIERQRPEKHAIDNAEDRRVRTDAQRKRENSHQCVPRVLPQNSHAVL